MSLAASGLPVLAIVSGKALTETPADLFIPPDALRVLLDSFSGPLDLLLYLIRRQNLDILDIPVAHITQQYMQYIHLMEENRHELAADYLVMAAMLAEIKSRLLLPVSHVDEEESDEDPRMVLVRKLQIYEQFKQAAETLDTLPRCERDIFRITLVAQGLQSIIRPPDVVLSALTDAMRALVTRQGHEVNHLIMREPLSVRERMASILERLQPGQTIQLTALLDIEEGRMGLAVTFLAVLELARQSLLMLTQISAYAPIYLQAIQHG